MMEENLGKMRYEQAISESPACILVVYKMFKKGVLVTAWTGASWYEVLIQGDNVHV